MSGGRGWRRRSRRRRRGGWRRWWRRGRCGWWLGVSSGCGWHERCGGRCGEQPRGWLSARCLVVVLITQHDSPPLGRRGRAAGHSGAAARCERPVIVVVVVVVVAFE
eukprot:4721477-Prymnesium_polylepis.1